LHVTWLLILLIVLFLLALIYGGFSMFHWFGSGANVNVNVHS